MRKIITVALSAALVVGAFGAPAAEAGKKKAKPRKASAMYEGPAIGIAGAGICSPDTLGCFGFGTAANEKFVEVEIVDDLGTPVFASVTQDLDGDNMADTSVDICGKSTEPIPIDGGYEVTVFLWEGPSASPPCASVVSSGEINVTFNK